MFHSNLIVQTNSIISPTLNRFDDKKKGPQHRAPLSKNYCRYLKRKCNLYTHRCDGVFGILLRANARIHWNVADISLRDPRWNVHVIYLVAYPNTYCFWTICRPLSQRKYTLVLKRSELRKLRSWHMWYTQTSWALKNSPSDKSSCSSLEHLK